MTREKTQHLRTAGVCWSVALGLFVTIPLVSSPSFAGDFPAPSSTEQSRFPAPTPEAIHREEEAIRRKEKQKKQFIPETEEEWKKRVVSAKNWSNRSRKRMLYGYALGFAVMVPTVRWTKPQTTPNYLGQTIGGTALIFGVYHMYSWVGSLINRGLFLRRKATDPWDPKQEGILRQSENPYAR